MNENLTHAILEAVLTATPEQKSAALSVLLGKQTNQPHTTGPLLLGMTDAARLLGVSRATLWRMIRRRNIPKIELFPGSYRLRRSDIEDIAAVKKGGAS